MDLEIASGAIHGRRLELALRNAEFEPDTAKVWRWRVNLRGTGFACRDVVVKQLTARVGEDTRHAEVKTTGLAGFLLAKVSAARVRCLPKDWYDIAFVLIHNDLGGPDSAARRIREVFGAEVGGSVSTALHELVANFETPDSQGARAYVTQMMVDYPESDPRALAADAVVAVDGFRQALFP